MLSDFKNSIDKILHERLTSPFWGAFISSWLVFNWRIPYVSIFVDQDKLPNGTTRIDYIINTCITDRWEYITLYPLISTAIIILLFPFISTGAYWVSLKFTKWKTDMKNRVDGATLLTLEKSVQLREELRNLNKKYEEINKDNEEEVRVLNAEIVKLQEERQEKDATINEFFNKEKEIEKEQELNKQKIIEYETQLEKAISENESKQQEILLLREGHNQSKIDHRNKLLELEEEISRLKKTSSFRISENKRIIDDLKSNFQDKTIDNFFKTIITGGILGENSKIFRAFQDFKLITSSEVIVNRDGSVLRTSKYKLTRLGEEIKNYFYNES